MTSRQQTSLRKSSKPYLINTRATKPEIDSKPIHNIIAVPAQKILGGNEVLPKFCDVCPNHDFIVHFGYDKKMS